MRFFFVIMILVVCFYSCNSSKQSVEKKDEISPTALVDTIIIENKELDYEIIIMDIGFDSWLVTQRSSNFFTQATLESKNKFYVLEWNRRVIMPQAYNPNLYMHQIDYDPQVDYGMDVNYLLYMYFQFFQEKYNQRLF